MRIATLQFNPQVGQVAANFSRAESLLMRVEREGLLQDLDLLVLPELAFTGPSTRWAARTAKRLKCTVAVGYPEAAEEGNFNTIFDQKIVAEEWTVAHNALVIVSAAGDVVAHYRKSFLYYTDETWATEGSGFYAGVLPIGESGQQVKAAAGICMDINPYKFEAPWTLYEFANHVREARAKVVILSTAWLTHISMEAITDQAMAPDTDTVAYWIERFRPLMDGATGAEEEVILVFANRVGTEGICPRIGEVKYAGSSCVMALKKGQEVKIWNILGRAQEGVLLVDTKAPARFTFARQKPESEETISNGAADIGEDQAAVTSSPQLT